MKKNLPLALLALSISVFAKDTLTVYSYDSFTSDWGAGPKLEKTLEDICDCDVKFVAFEDGVTMFNRLRLEGNSPKADVVIGLDNNLLKDAENTSIFATTDIDISQIHLPIPWDNKTFIPFDWGQYAFIYDRTKLDTPPDSLKALIEDEKISVIYQDPRTSTVGRGLLAWVNEVYGENAETAWKQLAKHTVTVGKGWSETYGAFLKGESDAVLSYITSPLYHQINENNNNYRAMTFTEGHIVQIELVAKLKTSKNPLLADEFIQFMLTPASQKTIALSNIMLPVIKTEIEPRFDAFEPAKTLAVPRPKKSDSKAQLYIWQMAVSSD